jgi:cellulose synthase/poly-beta-1,6-N-acetylglucosamine synthase-like glycosyltransferase
MVAIGLILQILVVICFAIPIAIFGTYGLLIVYYNKSKKDDDVQQSYANNAGNFSKPTVSIVVPTHNEKAIIAKKIENFLSLNYPQDKMEIVFADDSNDETPKIIAEYERKYSCIHLLQFKERMGYSPSMIAGVKAAKGEITVLGDAGSFLDSEALNKLVVHFQNPKVGAVTGNDVILNVDEQVGESESLYQKIYNYIRTAETKMDSTLYIKGEATAVRSELIKDFNNCFETFDTAVGLFIRQKGFRTVYDPQVKFYEYAAASRTDRVKQKRFRATYLIRVLLRFKHLMFKKEYGKYGSIILPLNFAMLSIAPISILTGFLLLIPLTFFNFLFAAAIWGFMGLVLVATLVFSRSAIVTFVDLESSLIKALYEVTIKKKSLDKIETVASTRRTN